MPAEISLPTVTTVRSSKGLATTVMMSFQGEAAGTPIEVVAPLQAASAKPRVRRKPAEIERKAGRMLRVFIIVPFVVVALAAAGSLHVAEEELEAVPCGRSGLKTTGRRFAVSIVVSDDL